MPSKPPPPPPSPQSTGPYQWPRRRAAAPFRPHFTLYLLYLLGAFLLFALVLILPELLELLENTPPGPEQQELALELAREASSGRKLPAFMLALATIGLGAYYKVLPGMRGQPQP